MLSIMLSFVLSKSTIISSCGCSLSLRLTFSNQSFLSGEESSFGWRPAKREAVARLWRSVSFNGFSLSSTNPAGRVMGLFKKRKFVCCCVQLIDTCSIACFEATLARCFWSLVVHSSIFGVKARITHNH
ncbi:unnamed protein product [Moneuplotes crassus]|uniref:Uncharacterized protein n=1 Tax=Euplotes crassus TaxID=5936 RepID=A0AAD2CZC7_EUPCR|nr:unnamed protein product [Moneuplotes crassus]